MPSLSKDQEQQIIELYKSGLSRKEIEKATEFKQTAIARVVRQFDEIVAAEREGKSPPPRKKKGRPPKRFVHNATPVSIARTYDNSRLTISSRILRIAPPLTILRCPPKSCLPIPCSCNKSSRLS